MRLARLMALAASLLLLGITPALAGKDLDAVKKKGFIQAGVNGGVFGFGMPDEKGVWRGLDVDTAHAIAAAIFGDAKNRITSYNVCYTKLLRADTDNEHRGEHETGSGGVGELADRYRREQHRPEVFHLEAGLVGVEGHTDP